MKNNIENIYNLTPMQAGMLYHKMVDEAPRQYFLQQVIRMNGELDEGILRSSVKLLSARHDILRTQFVIPRSTGKPRQVVLAEKDIEVNCIDLRLIPASDREQELEKIIRSDTLRGFNLEKDSLLRLTFARLGNGESALVWSVHHIIVDGWSLPILLADFMGYYMRLQKGEDRDALLKETEQTNMYSPRFSDYIKWQEKQDIRKGLEYWDDVLQDYGSTAFIPPMKAKRQSSGEVDAIAINLGEGLSNGLKELSARHGVTLSSILETAWGVLLQRYNGVDDVVFGKVVSGRNARIPGIEKMVGLFINTIPVRVRSSSDTTFLQLVAAQQEQALECERYSYCALGDIQRRSRMGPDLFRTLYVFENYYIDTSINDIFDGMEMRTDEYTEQTNYPVTLKCVATDRVMMELIYDNGMYSLEEMQLLGNKLSELLAGAVLQPEARIWDISFLGEAERRQVLVDFNDTYMPYNSSRNIINVFEGHANRQQDAEAVYTSGESVSYGMLNARANRIAHRLLGLGAGSGKLVVLQCRRGAELVAGMLGIMKTGAAYLPLDPDLPQGRAAMIAEDSGAVAIVSTGGNAYNLPLVHPSGDTLRSERIDNPGKAIRPDDAAYCIYTSGTTGKPKGVLVPHRGLTNLYFGSEKMFGLDESSRILQYSNSMFDVSVWDLAMSLMSGGTLCIVSDEQRMSLPSLERFIAESRVTSGLLPPHILIHMDATAMGRVMSGGSASSPAVVSSQPGTEYLNAYGPTEITVCATCWRYDPSSPVPDSIPIGKPLPNVQAYILEGMDLCGIGLPGELCIGGEGVAIGYLNMPEHTADRFIQNPFGDGRLYRTGDLARWLPDGNIEFLGRIDGQVKLRGYRIEPAEIEAALRQQEGVIDAAVLLREDDSRSQALYGYIVSNERVDVARLRSSLSDMLPIYMIPSHIVQLERMPLTPNGKLDRDALPTVDVREYGFVPPRNREEQEIASIFGQVLGVDDIGADGDFFELGGDSMKAIQISAMLSRMSRDITVREIFQLRSVEQIATRLRSLNQAEALSSPEEPQPDAGASPTAMDKHSLLKDIDVQLAGYSRQLLAAGVERVSGLSPAQVLTYELGVLSSYCAFNIDQPYEPKRALAAWNSILRQFGLLRSCIEYVDGAKRLHHLAFKSLKRLPFVDISAYGQGAAKGIMELVMAHTHAFATPEEYDGSSPAHRVLVLRTGEAGFTLLMPVSHLIYDAFSNEVIRGRFAELYAGGAEADDNAPYDEYIRQISEGPGTMSEDEIIESLALDDFEQSLAACRARRENTALTTLDCEISIPEGTDGLEAIKLADRVAAAALRYTHRGGKVPLLMVHTGRSYKEHSHTDEIGEFIDFIPMVFDTSVEGAGILATAVEKLRFMREHNINMAALAIDDGLGSRFPRIRRILESIDWSRLELQVINLLLMYDADMSIGAMFEALQPGAVDGAMQPDSMDGAMQPDAAQDPGRDRASRFLNIIRAPGGILLKNLECPKGEEQRMRSYLVGVSQAEE